MVRDGVGVTVRVCVRVGVGVIVGGLVGVGVAVIVQVAVGVRDAVAVGGGVGGDPVTTKLPELFHSMPTNTCTSYSPGSHTSGEGLHSVNP